MNLTLRRTVVWTALCLAALVGAACQSTGGGSKDGGRSCAAGQLSCSAGCVDGQTDDKNCGACGVVCGQTEICSAGLCKSACPNGRAACNGNCVDLSINNANCGACGVACSAAQSCVNGACACGSGTTVCGPLCVNLATDADHCGTCTNTCPGGQSCVNAACYVNCPSPTVNCSNACVDTTADDNNCGGCGRSCQTPTTGKVCTAGACACPLGGQLCGGVCVDIQGDDKNCGACGAACGAGSVCNGGHCEAPCPAGTSRCGNLCVDLKKSFGNCGTCLNACGAGQTCSAGTCASCSGPTNDCDGDGWTPADGDCCDSPGACGTDPTRVNPGAVEIAANSIDDNCNGLVDSADVAANACDTALASNSTDAGTYARALGICQTTTESPAQLKDKTWGLISAQLLRVNGTPLTFSDAVSIRPNFGTAITPREGSALMVISSGVAADKTQTNPGPNELIDEVDVQHSFPTNDMVDIKTCSLPYCVKDWFSTPNPPLKAANRLPQGPTCQATGLGADHQAYDSVTLVLRLRAPTNARSFRLAGYFLSAEYAEFVCTDYNDQLVVLVDTPAPTAPLANPTDKNLMTYTAKGARWPIGVNIANGTGVFAVCEPKSSAPTGCFSSDVSTLSCSKGPAELAGTGLESPMPGVDCTTGGGTGWLETAGNVIPGEIVELRIALWDAGDDIYDSIALFDAFRWSAEPVVPGTE